MQKFQHAWVFILFLTAFEKTHADVDRLWRIKESQHFLIYHHPNATSPEDIVDIAEDFYPQLDRLIGDAYMEKIEIWVCQTSEQFRATVHAPIQDWAVGCAYPLSRRIIIQNPRVIIQHKFQLSEVIRHEIVHVIFGQRTRHTIDKIPLWFVEGIATYLSSEWTPQRSDLLMKHIFSKSIIPLADLTEEFPKAENLAQLAYAVSQNAVAWLAETEGIEKLWEIIDRLGNGSNLSTAFRDTIGSDLSAFESKWKSSLSQRYHWAAIFSNSYLFWGSLTAFFGLIYLRSRHYKRHRLNELADEEASGDAFFKD